MVELEGQIFLVQKMPENFHDLATKASIQKDIDKGNFIPPPGHVSILKNDPEDESKHTIISTGGADFEQGKEWGFAEDLFGTHFLSTADKFEVLKLDHVQSFATTSASGGMRMEKCAAMVGYSGGTMVDLKAESEPDVKLIKFGGQNVETMKTENRMEEITGSKEFDVEVTNQGKPTFVSTFQVKCYPSKKRRLNSYVTPNEFNIDEEEIQKNAPTPRRGHQMAQLRGSSYVMTGGVIMPEAGPKIEHPHDSSTWLLDVTTKEWDKCEDCEYMIRAGHMMMVHKERLYVVGGYTYEHYKLKKLFPMDEVVEAAIVTKDIIITRKFVVTNLTGENIPNIYGFSYTSSSNFMYCYGGHEVPHYQPNEENLHIFHNPECDRHKLLEQSSVLFQIDVEESTIKSLKTPPDYKTANGTMQIISKTENGEAEKIVIFGGYNRQILLYSKHEFVLTKCDLEEEYGACRLRVMTPTTCSENYQSCGKIVHLDCDMFKEIRKEQVYKCPSCKNLDPKTGKVRPKQRVRKNRGQ
jgi:hypothetical protein